MNNKNNQFSQENVHYPYLASASPSSDAADSGISRREFLGIAAASMFLARADQEAPPTEPRNDIPYRTLGRTREKTRCWTGCYHLGKQANPQESIGIIRKGLDEGINLFRQLLGLQRWRVKSVWATRCATPLSESISHVQDRWAHQGRSQAKSTGPLRRLQTDRIDLLQFHEVIRDTYRAAFLPPEER